MAKSDEKKSQLINIMNKTILRLEGLATGVGSLPYQEADKALDLIFKYLPEVPFWPQLPKRDIREGMTMQFSEGLPCLAATPSGLVFNPRNREEELETFYSRVIASEVEHFGISPDFAQGFGRFMARLEDANLKDVVALKCHITGPFTFAASIKDEKGISLLHDEIMMQAILKGLVMKALWQIRTLERFGKKIILFIDEPYLGCFGSAYTPINRQDVIRVLDELTGALCSDKVLVGVHCCGNTDWSIFTEASGVDMISFDAFNFLERLVLYARELGAFLERGGILCWGMVPTQDFSAKLTADFLAERIKRGVADFAAKGMDQNLLLNSLFLSPSCGLGALEESNAEPIFKLLQGLSRKFRK